MATGGHILCNGGFRIDNTIFAERQMSCCTSMPRNIYSVTKRCAARNTDLCSEAAIFSDDNIVCDLDKIIQFGAAFDERFRECRPIDGCIRANLNIVFNDDGADLRDFVVSVANGCESETVAPNNRSTMDNHPITDGYFFSNTDVWVDKSISTYLGSFADVDKGVDNGVISNFNVVTDMGERLD